jgi:hypothetical protein
MIQEHQTVEHGLGNWNILDSETEEDWIMMVVGPARHRGGL